MKAMTVPDRTEATDYYFTYIDQVGPGDIVEILSRQGREMSALFELASGAVREGPADEPLRTYPTRVVDGRVEVEV